MKLGLRKKLIILLIFIAYWGFFTKIFACTSFIIHTKDNNISITGRSYDYHIKSKFNTTIFQPGETIHSIDNRTSWNVKFEFITINNVINNIEIPFEGVNKAGISISGNLADAEYPKGKKGPLLSSDDIIRYILSNAESLDEVKNLFKQINISSKWQYHYIIFDQKGNNLIIEFKKNKSCFYENKSPILTNNPDIDFQLNNLKTYSNLRPYNSKDISPESGNQFHGAGMHGLPGDWMSPSRFVRGTQLLKNCTKYVTSNKEAIILATKILDSVSLIKGIDLGKHKTGLPIYTQIQIIKDLIKHKIYLREYGDLSWKLVTY